MTEPAEKFICEQIKPVQGTFDTSAMSIGAPGFPRRFVWRKKEYELDSVLEQWKETGNCHHGSAEKYVRKHWYKIRTACGKIMIIYFDRQGRSKREMKNRWWLHNVIEESRPQWQLIGGLKLGPSAPGDYSFHGDLFSRLPKEVEHTGDLTRYVAFDYLTAENDSITFLGIEVDNIGAIPDGLMAWDFDGDRLSIRGNPNIQSVCPETGKTSRWTRQSPADAAAETAESRKAVNSSSPFTPATGEVGTAIIYEADVDWGWRSGSDSFVGEFCVTVPAEWTGTSSSEERLFSMTANCYVAPGGKGADDAVELVGYDPSWPERFTEFSHWLQDRLGDDVALRIEHFGSTAIPGMMAKPIIDVLVQVPSFPEAKQRAIPLFNKEDWEYWWYGDHPVFIKRDGFQGRRTHHVHMMVEGPDLQKRLAFRDYLKTHTDDAAEYARLKQQLAACNRDDREAYTDAKADFVSKVAAQAMNLN